MLRCALAFFVAALCFVAGPALAAKRVALIIGNSVYEHASTLANPGNDAKAVAAALDAIGFDEVLVKSDLDQRSLLKALKEFSAKSAGADTALIYFAGHGVEVDNRNYLVPTDATLAAASDVEFEAVELDKVRASVAGATTLRLVILDACRNNPFKLASEGSGRSVGRGLAKVEPGANEIVAFAAKEGTIAADGEGANSPFAAALVKHLATPGLEINFLFRRVRDDVLTATGKRQEPFTYGTLGAEEVFLHSAAAGSTDASSSPTAEVAELAEQVKKLQEELEKQRKTAGGTEVDTQQLLDARMEEQRIARMADALKENVQSIYRAASSPFIGATESEVTVVEFFDYNCQFCRRAMPDIIKLTSGDPKLKLVFKEFPIFGEDSEAAARAAIAAKNQGKYWEMHKGLFEHEGKLTEESALAVAHSIGLDVEKLKADMAAPETRKELYETRELAKRLGIRGTPTFFLGEQVIEGAPEDLYDQLYFKIADIRKAGCRIC